MQKGIISIEIDPITFEETERYRRLILILIENGVLNWKNGSVTLHFDPRGELALIDTNRRWKVAMK